MSVSLLLWSSGKFGNADAMKPSRQRPLQNLAERFTDVVRMDFGESHHLCIFT